MTFEIEQEVMKRQPDYPAEQSESGSNAYAMMCDHVGYRSGYCVCLNKIKAYKVDKSRLSPYPVCEKAIRSTMCPALDMQRQEVSAGKAMFFLDRLELRAAMDKFYDANASYKPSAPPKPLGSRTALKTATTKPDEKVSENLLQSESSENGFAAAINAAIRDLPKEEPKEIPPVVKVPIVATEKKGLSMLELARLKIAQAKST